jgi:dihydrofolate reductase
VDWLLWGEEIEAFMKEFWKKIDTVLWGRKTYEVALRSGGMASYPGVKNYVFSRTLKSSAEKDFEIVSEDAAGFVRNLKQQAGEDIVVMGGGEFAKMLFEAGLIDEIGFNIHPVLLGSGIPLFHEMKRQIDLELIECKPFKNGCVLVTYRVKS